MNSEWTMRRRHRLQQWMLLVRVSFVCLLCGCFTDAGQNSTPPTRPPTIPPQSTPVLEGYCPVTLIDKRSWELGDERWTVVHEGHTYLFVGQQQQQKFLKSPDLYAPLMAGHDPVRFAETGQLVPGKREFGVYVVDPGPIALFADESSLQRFEQNPGEYDKVLRASAQSPQEHDGDD